ncbi:MAG: recombination protein RmuC [Pseudomonadota bacterium]|jgi:DNA recombination protein RmuC
MPSLIVVLSGLAALLSLVGVILLLGQSRRGSDATLHAKEARDAVQRLSAELSELQGRLGALADSQPRLRSEVAERIDAGFRTNTEAIVQLRTDTLGAMNTFRGTLDTALKTELEQIRKTVDDKLHETLEKRLGESFKRVSDQLESVHRGLGEMQTLATGVGDLRKVLTNVKTRGSFGEVQLDNLLEQILTAEQYDRNVAVVPGSAARVEFALRLPGRSDGAKVHLPIDAKFPIEDYQRLLDAQDRGDVAGVDEAGKALETRIRQEGRTIREKYIAPPDTTDFAVMYLATEGLYAEALRRPGLVDWLQRDCKVVLCGPTTLAAMLNSLQMGFRTLAIEKRSSEVWEVLGAVKTEFGKFGEALAHTKKKLEEATHSIEKAQTRNNVLTRRLKGVDQLPEPEAAGVLGTTRDVDTESEED